ncbi:sulfatase PB10D8.02c [Penicillium argentinense]|uniref:Sulfatase PB10D8.02c n=1 Tax=Penicillium argentinense TaxID=1131581 RepID=A0A9W9KNG5_9EURO|nr:sulfatase PB10D8.02c [Penicillium argentinense]KAJ5111973.1 sulfatase PB10D8.02c [Penicillium argentinense]
MASKHPNFLILIADDLGFSDISPYGSEIKTPVLDKLAQDGIRMTNFHTAAACSPTRAMLFSGTDNHIAGLGQMSEATGTPHKIWLRDQPGYEGYLNLRVAALPEILQDAGYFTMLSGKCSRTMSFFLPAMANKKFWMEGDKFLNFDTDLPKEFYSAKTFTDKALGFLENRTAEEAEQPFFACMTYTAPHWPLQAPQDIIDKYRGVYDKGPDALTQSRLKRLQDLGLVKPGVDHAPPEGRLGPPWEELTDSERSESARKMETFAAMVELLDTNIGRIVDYLTKTGELDNTFILFMSDNGAEGAALEAAPIMGGADTMASVINKHYNNNLENIGNPDSWIWYGPRWACAATAPSRGTKGQSTEGGIRCPCLLHYPPLAPKAGAITHAFTTAMDIMPTILELAEVKHPGTRFRNRDVVEPRGKSWVKHLGALGSNADGQAENSVHGEDSHVHRWELYGMRAIRMGRWKAVYIPPPKGKDGWQLYNVEDDPAEMKDLSETEVGIMKELEKLWERYFMETGMVNVEFPGWANTH